MKVGEGEYLELKLKERDIQVVEIQVEKYQDQSDIKKLSIRIEGIPSTKIADLNRGVLMPLSREVGGFEFTMEIDIDKEDGGVSESTIKDKVKETVSQIGAKVTKEVVE